jgi:hypothetical protein
MNRVTGDLFKAGLLALVFAAGTAQAQDKPKEAPLEGPKVRDNSMPGRGRGLGEADRRPGDGLRLPVIMKALDVLRGDKAGENKLTEEQEKSIKTALEDFQKASREFTEKNREELASLRSQLTAEDRAKLGEGRPRPGPNGKGKEGGKPEGKPADGKPGEDEMMAPPADAKPDAEASKKALARIQEILASRPNPETAQTKAWSTLSDSQKKLLEAEIKRLTEEMQKKGKPGEAGNLDDLKGKTPEEIMNDPRVPERLRERLKNMSPEERKEAIKRFLERSREGGPRRPGGDGEGKPAPKSSDVNVPAPR